MPSFEELISSKRLGYKGIIKVLECVVEWAEKNQKPVDYAFVIMDTFYRGIRYTYENYTSSGHIKIITPGGVVHYQSSGKQTTENDLSKNRENASLTVKAMAINATGVREGEVINGIANGSKKAIVKITSGFVPPSKDDLDDVRMFPELWNVLLRKLGGVDYFKEMSLFEREVWLGNNERKGEYDIADAGVNFEVLDVGDSDFLKLSPEDITSVLSGQVPLAIDVRNLFPRKPGSKARRPTLMFFLHRWKLATTYQKTNSFKGPVYIKGKGFVDGARVFGEDIFTLDGFPSTYDRKGKGYIVKQKGDVGTTLNIEKTAHINYFEVLTKLGHSAIQIARVTEACKNFTPAGYKSLLQKLIRTSPERVNVLGEYVNSGDVLKIVFTLLLTDPGSFVPDIQRYVSGRESALKRLLVSTLEDSYMDSNSDMLHLSFLALLAQRVSTWRISEEDYEWALKLCDRVISSDKTFDYEIDAGLEIKPYTISATSNDLENMSAILDEIRSFPTDLAMARSIAKNKGSVSKDRILRDRPKIMEIYHCIDQHWAPELVYFMPIEIIEKNRVNSSKPFSLIFKKIFGLVTGVNSRHSPISQNSDDKKFIEVVKDAQRLTLLAKQTTPAPLKKARGVYSLKTTLDMSWIAGMAGAIDVPGRPPVMVTMKPNDPYQLVALKKPARGMKDGKLTDQRIEEAISKVEKQFSTVGIVLNKATPPVPELEDITLKKDGEEYVFIKKGHSKTWEELSLVEKEISYAETKELTFENAIKYGGDGIQLNSKKMFDEVCSRYDSKIIRRTLSYISSYNSVIEISRLSKDGGGSAQAVMIEDVGACQILLWICLLFPRALKRMEGYISRFKVDYAPLFWEVRDQLRETREILASEISSADWGTISDTSGRQVRSYQTDSINEMVEKINSGKKGHFIWIPAGLGKTMIALSYIQNLIEMGKMPEYVIYTLPVSATKSIATEIDYFGFQINVIIPVDDWKNHPLAEYSKDRLKLLPGHINIIEHDHMRRVSDYLISKAPESVFIVDEVHKALNDTQRTGTALEISRASFDFVAMTGTPIIDSNMYKLIWWLEQIVEFEVNEKNFWVATNGMIAKKVNTGVLVDSQNVMAEMSERESQEYYKLVPLAMGGTNTRPSSKDLLRATELCYNACDREMIRQTLLFLDEGVMLVAKTETHQTTLLNMLIKAGIKRQDIHIFKDSIFMTDEAVEEGSIPDYKVVIVPMRKSEGYTLTRMRTMIRSVYPSNNATREQLEGRINRVSQHAKEIHYRTIHTGILTYIMEKHNTAASISAVLSAIAEEI